MSPPDLLPSNYLINVIASCSGIDFFRPRGDYHPQFTLLLGAGASSASGIPLASGMVREFEKQYARQYGPAALKKETWYRSDNAYSELFERLYAEPSLRRDYVERQLERATPSWGYLYLVNLLSRNIFNTVFTTNFDDLLNESCYLFSSDVRPLVCAHDSSIRSVRMSSKRPKIIKLHGDFLYDRLKNTLLELESLEQNMRDKFKQFAAEYGLIVIGYSGNDRSIMDVIDALIVSEDAFPHGVYWCVRSKRDVTAKVERLSRFRNFHLVMIDGFDEFMAELHDRLCGESHPAIDNPYYALAQRMTRLLNNLPRKTANEHAIIERDAINLGKSVRTGDKLKSVPMPYIYMANAALRDDDIPQAKEYLLQQLRDESSTLGALHRAIEIAADVIKTDSDDTFRNNILDAIRAHAFTRQFPVQVSHVGLKLIASGHLTFAMDLFDCCKTIAESLGVFDENYYLINKAHIRILQRKPLDPEHRSSLRRISQRSSSPAVRFGAHIALRQYKRAIEQIKKNLSESYEKRVDVDYILSWPISALLPRSYRKELEGLRL